MSEGVAFSRPLSLYWGDKMKFKAEPNLYVRISNKYVQRVTGKKGICFDKNGEYETDNEVLIKVMSQSFETVENIKEHKHKCSKCDFEATSKGELLAHHRKEHKKGVE